MSKDDLLVFNGTILDKLPNATFKVELENGHQLIAYVAGKMQKNNINLYVGDKVEVSVTPYDLTKGRITWRR